MKKQIIKLVLQLPLIVMLVNTLTELNNNLLMSSLVTLALLLMYDVGEEIGRDNEQ